MPTMFKRGGAVFLFVILASGCGGGSSTTTSPSPTPTPASLDPSITLSVVSPTGFDTLLLAPVSVTGVWGDGTHLTPTSPATTVNYTTRLSVGTYGIELQPIQSGSSGASISFSGALAGNTGGVQPNSIVVVSVLHDATHIKVDRCSVTVPSDVGEIDVTFVVMRADSTQVC